MSSANYLFKEMGKLKQTTLNKANFGFSGHIGNKFGLRGPVKLHKG